MRRRGRVECPVGRDERLAAEHLVDEIMGSCCYVAAILLMAVVCGVIAAVIAESKGRAGLGFLVGFLFGPFGILIACLLPTRPVYRPLRPQATWLEDSPKPEAGESDWADGSAASDLYWRRRRQRGRPSSTGLLVAAIAALACVCLIILAAILSYSW